MADRKQGLPPPPRVAEPKAIRVLQARETGILNATRRGSARDTPADGRDPARASARGRIEMRRQRPNMEIAADAPHFHRHWVESIPRNLL